MHPASKPAAIVSIHDVMPTTLSRVETCLCRLARHGIHSVDLLVVPGKSWRKDELDQLRCLESAGHQLAGHGWLHDIERYGSFAHRLHGRLISRRTAEHLALSPTQRAALMTRCRHWFETQGFMLPQLYVPPAWALGNRNTLRQASATGFRWIETLAGVHDLHTDRFLPLPLLGYEADNRFREYALTLSNHLSGAIWRCRGPVRLGIHPDDFELRLGSSLDSLLVQWQERGVKCLTLQEALDETASASLLTHNQKYQ